MLGLRCKDIANLLSCSSDNKGVIRYCSYDVSESPWLTNALCARDRSSILRRSPIPYRESAGLGDGWAVCSKARGMALTAAGQVFLNHARLALMQIEVAGEAARATEKPEKE